MTEDPSTDEVNGEAITAQLPMVQQPGSPSAGRPSTPAEMIQVRPGPTAPPPYLAAPQGPSQVLASGPPARSGKVAGWTILVMLFAGIIVAAAGMPGGFPTAAVEAAPSSVAVPQTAGSSVEAASRSLTAAGLKLGGQQTEPSQAVPAGNVIGSQPPAGTVVDVGTVIALLVSSGPGSKPVPQLIGLSLAEAREELKRAGLIAGAITVEDGPQPGTQVLKTVPGFDAAVSPLTPIAITVASGRNKIPSRLQGQSVRAAQLALTSAGFAVQLYEQENSGTVPGVVLSATPAEGRTAPLGSIVTLYVSMAPPKPSPSETLRVSPEASPAPSPLKSTIVPSASPGLVHTGP